MSDASSVAIGIDLGTTYCCIGVHLYSKTEIIANNETGNRTTPSYVAFTEEDRLIGEPAKSQVALNPENTVYDAKRLIGRRFDDATVQEDKKHWPFLVVNSEGLPKIKLTYKQETKCFCAQEISSMLLSKMKEIAEIYLKGKTVTEAVITVPAYFNNNQRQATKDAAEIAELKDICIINEPTAAAIAYGLNNKSTALNHVFIFDLGGGTFDVAILQIKGSNIEMLTTDGDTHLGGADFDNRLVKHFIQQFRLRHKHDISTNKRAVQRLKKQCEIAKRSLSTAVTTQVTVDALYEGIDFNMQLSRSKFEDLCSDLFQETLTIVDRCFASVSLTKEDIDEIILVGGSTRIPKVQSVVKEYFNNKELNNSIHVDEAVAYGAAVHAAAITKIKSPAMQKPVVTISDVTPLSLGTPVIGDLMNVIIPKNSKIPIDKSKNYFTVKDNQKVMNVDIYEGERTMVADNHFLQQFSLTGLPPRPGGQSKVLVTFCIDRDGILTVTAVGDGFDSKNKIKVTNNGSLPVEKMERMIREAERFREEDRLKRESVQTKNMLEETIYSVLGDLENKIFRQRDHQILENVCKEVESWFEKNKNATKEDYESTHKLLDVVWKTAKRN